MNYYLIVGLVALAGLLALSFPAYYYFNPKSVPTCFSVANYHSAVAYMKWKKNTSKIGKVLVNDYEVRLEDNEHIVFLKKEWPVFKVSEHGIMLLPIYQTKRLRKRCETSFCSLVKFAKNRGY